LCSESRRKSLRSLPSLCPGFCLPTCELGDCVARDFQDTINHDNIRSAEVDMLNAEKWASLAWLYGATYPARELAADWRAILSTPHSGGATPSTVGQNSSNSQVSANKIINSSFQAIVDKIDTTGEGIPIVIFNPLSWARIGRVKIRAQVPYKKGYHFLLTRPHVSEPPNYPYHVIWDKQTGLAEMEAIVISGVGLGYYVYRLVLEPDNTGFIPEGDWIPPRERVVESASSIRLYGRHVELTVDKSTGCITGLKMPVKGYHLAAFPFPSPKTHLPDDEDLVAPGGCANQLQAFRVAPRNWNAWDIQPQILDQPLTMPATADSVVVLDSETDYPGVRITRHWRNSRIIQTVRLGWEMQKAEIDSDIDWHEKDVQLKAAVPVAVQSDHATYEVPYGAIERPNSQNTHWQTAEPEPPPMRWVDLAGTGRDNEVRGLTIISEAGHEFDAAGNLLRITLLHPSVPKTGTDRGRYRFRYALYPHLGTWKDSGAVRLGWEINNPLEAKVATSHPGSPSDNNPEIWVYRMDPKDSVVVTSVKKAEDGDALIVRLYEWAGNESKLYLAVPAGMTGARIANLAGEPVGDWLPIDEMRMHGTIIPVSIHPYEIMTLRVEYELRN
jgi:alpha-mannosidase